MFTRSLELFRSSKQCFLSVGILLRTGMLKVEGKQAIPWNTEINLRTRMET